jgi:cytochrome P450
MHKLSSDTTAVNLTHILYHLAKDPTQYTKLRAELLGLVKSPAEFSIKDVQDAPFLNGCINEALRLHPPVPSAMYRVTPRGGIMVGTTHIPGGVTVSSPNYSLGRRKSHISNLQRWTGLGIFSLTNCKQ